MSWLAGRSGPVTVITASGHSTRTTATACSADTSRTIPAPPRSAPPTASAAAPVYRSLPATMPTTPRRYLSESAGGRGSARADVGGLQRDEVGRAEERRQADVDQLDHPGVAGARVDQQPGLQRAERHRHVGLDRRPGDHAGVRVHPAGQVHRHHHGPGPGGQPGQRRLRLAQPAPAADAEQAVQDQVGRADRGRHPRVVRAGHPAAGRAERRGARLVDLGRGP